MTASRDDSNPSEQACEAARERLRAVQKRIDAAAQRAGRDPAEVTLVGVAKKQPLERTLAAIAAGVRVLGQSYIQEAREVRPAIEAALASDPETAALRARMAHGRPAPAQQGRPRRRDSSTRSRASTGRSWSRPSRGVPRPRAAVSTC